MIWRALSSLPLFRYSFWRNYGNCDPIYYCDKRYRLCFLVFRKTETNMI